MQKEIHRKDIFHRPNKSSGTHRLDGMFILKGPGIKAGQVLEGAKIMDLAPTMLYAAGMAVPEDMDGSVLSEAFMSGHASANPVSFCPAPGQGDGFKDCDGILDKEESEKLKKMLRELGYV